MALIKCPNCGKEVSDKANRCVQCGYEFVHQEMRFCQECGTEIPIGETECPNCGFPVENTHNQNGISVTNNQTVTKKKNIAVIIIPIVVVVLIAVIGVVFYNINVVKPKKIEAQNKATYDEAVELLEKGKYDEANEIFNTIPDYEDVDILQEQLFYESRVFQCVNSLKERLKNPDSLQIYEVVFLDNKIKDSSPDYIKEAFKDLLEKQGEEYVVMMRYGAQNGFGGNTMGYVMFIPTSNGYEFFCACDTLNEEEADDDEIDSCRNMNIMLDNFEQIGNVDIDRIKRILKDNNYTSIKIIEE